MDLGNRIKYALDMRGMNQKDLAKAMGTTEISISRYIHGDRMPKCTQIITMCKVLHVSADWLLGLKE